MDYQHSLTLIVLSCAPAALIGCIVLAVTVYRLRQTVQRSLASASQTAKRLAAVQRRLDEVSRHAAERAGRIAWLEARARREQTDDSVPAPPEPAAAARTSMTERRHRVLALTQRGMDPATIAETLGVPYGEVELIISLSTAAYTVA
ncbi:MAG TPA: hypothetical protein VJ302_08345 [Blastocatellia bacterium]|nr:hypothetical protein [Blastocatellia bacterium]